MAVEDRIPPSSARRSGSWRDDTSNRYRRGGLSALTKWQQFWLFGLAFEIVGVVFLIQGLLPDYG